MLSAPGLNPGMSALLGKGGTTPDLKPANMTSKAGAEMPLQHRLLEIYQADAGLALCQQATSTAAHSCILTLLPNQDDIMKRLLPPACRFACLCLCLLGDI